MKSKCRRYFLSTSKKCVGVRMHVPPQKLLEWKSNSFRKFRRSLFDALQWRLNEFEKQILKKVLHGKISVNNNKLNYNGKLPIGLW